MQEIESDFWFIALPEQWQTEQEDESILIYDEDQLGCICLTNLESDGGKPTERRWKTSLRKWGSVWKMGAVASLAKAGRDGNSKPRKRGIIFASGTSSALIISC